MPQVFPKAANPWSRASLVGLLFLALSAGWLVALIQRSDYVTAANQFIEQPVQFSHQHHVGGIGIDCRYCHTSVEQAASASIPPTQTCMNCHSQIWAQSPYLEPVRASWQSGESLEWIRVHDLPDFVYFNHSIHVRQGVGCATCHGRVDQMPLMFQASSLQMSWCLDCHRNPAQYVRPRDQVYNMAWERPADDPGLGVRLVQEYKIGSVEQLTSCSTCHR